MSYSAIDDLETRTAEYYREKAKEIRTLEQRAHPPEDGNVLGETEGCYARSEPIHPQMVVRFRGIGRFGFRGRSALPDPTQD